ncbi:hypothetical protein [Ascidiimonas aurantiaca]|uniref:hypothetical protein n=1 Tax=Ascidiimonas aurantiaca TaxID=1685432 RepID=UPI0030EE3031
MKKKRINQKLELFRSTISTLDTVKGGLPYTDPRVAACFTYRTNCVVDETRNLDCDDFAVPSRDICTF